MATVKHIGPGSAFKIGLVLYAFLGLIIGVMMAGFSMLMGSLGSMAGAGAAGAKAFGFGFGLGSIIIFPILYGIIGGIGGASLRRSTISLPVGLADSKSKSTEFALFLGGRHLLAAILGCVRVEALRRPPRRTP